MMCGSGGDVEKKTSSEEQKDELDHDSQDVKMKHHITGGGCLESDTNAQNYSTASSAEDELKPPLLISWHDVCVSTSEGRKLLFGPNHGVVREGEILALMGLSGGGKSTVINALVSGSQPSFPATLGKGCTMEGTVTTAPGLRIGYSPDQQHTVMLEDLTAREWLQYRVLTGVPNMPKTELDRHVKWIAESVGLVGEVLETRISVLSSGQRVRTMIAAEIAILNCGQQDNHDPQVLILDEPLSALDSATSMQVMETLQSLVKGTNKAVIMSLHQPRPEVYRICDNIVLLSQGHHVYFGPRVEAVSTVRRHCMDTESTLSLALDTSTFIDEDDSGGDRSAHYLLDAMVVSSRRASEVAKCIREEMKSEKTESEDSSYEEGIPDDHSASKSSDELVEKLSSSSLESTAGNSYVWYRARALITLVFIVVSRRRMDVFKYLLIRVSTYLLLGGIGWQIGLTYGTFFLISCILFGQLHWSVQKLPSLTVFYKVVANDIYCDRQSKRAFAIVCFLMAFLHAAGSTALSLIAYAMGSLAGGAQLWIYILGFFGYASFLDVFMYASLATFAHRGRTFFEVLHPAHLLAVVIPIILDFLAGLAIPFSLVADPFLGASVINPLGSAVRAVLRTRKDILAEDQTAVTELFQEVSSLDPKQGYYGYKSIFDSLGTGDSRDNIIEQFIFELFGTHYSTGVYLSILLGYIAAIMIIFCVALRVNSRRKSAIEARMSVVVPGILCLVFVSVLIYIGLDKIAPIQDDYSYGLSFNRDVTESCPECLNGFPSASTLRSMITTPDVLAILAIRNVAHGSHADKSLQAVEWGRSLPSLSENNSSWLATENEFWGFVPNNGLWPQDQAQELVSLENAEGKVAMWLSEIGFPRLKRLEEWGTEVFNLERNLESLNESLVSRFNVTASDGLSSGRLYYWNPTPGGDDLERHSLSRNETSDYKTVNARVLFYLPPGSDASLETVAIQLGDSHMPLLLPDRMEYTRCWDVARAHARHSMAVIGAGVSHVVQQHLVSSAFGLATREAFTKDHPVSRFLLPHLSSISIVDNGATLAAGFDVLPIPEVSTESLLPVLKGLAQEFSFLDAVNLTDVYDRQGLRPLTPHSKLMPMLESLWNAAIRYATKFVDLHFPSDSSVKDDKDIHEWTEMLTLANIRGLTKGGENRLETREDLAIVMAGVVSLILGHSIGHSIRTRDALYIPYAPFAIRAGFLPGPSSRCVLEDQLYLYGTPSDWHAHIRFFSGVMMPTPTHISTARSSHTDELFDEFMEAVTAATGLIEDPLLRNSVHYQLSADVFL